MISGQSSLFYGFAQPSGSGGALALNAAGTRMAYSFVATETTVNSHYLSLAAINGTAGNIKLTFSLRAVSTNGKPDSTPISEVEITGGWVANKLNPVAVSWSGLTLGTTYWVVIKNTSAAPATDYVTVTHSMAGTHETFGGLASGLSRYQTTDTEATWATGSDRTVGLTVKFASGQLNCFPKDATGTSDSGLRVYSGRKVGVTFKTPSHAYLSVIGATLHLRGNGSPPGNLFCELWVNGVLAATSPLIISAGLFAGAASVPVLWPFDGVIIPPESAVHVVCGLPGGDSNNYIYYNSICTINDDPVLKAAKPCNGTMSKIYWDGSVWTVTETQYGACCLIGNIVRPFAPAPLNRRRYFNQR